MLCVWPKPNAELVKKHKANTSRV